MSKPNSDYSAEERAKHLARLSNFDGSIVKYASLNGLNKRHVYGWIEQARKKKKQKPKGNRSSSFSMAKISKPVVSSQRMPNVSLRTKTGHELCFDAGVSADFLADLLGRLS